MLQPTSRNLLLEVQDISNEWAGGLIRPESARDGAGGLILRAKAPSCTTPVPIGAEVILDYESEDLKQNVLEMEGKRYFIIRENFVMAYFDPEKELTK